MLREGGREGGGREREGGREGGRGNRKEERKRGREEREGRKEEREKRGCQTTSASSVSALNTHLFLLHLLHHLVDPPTAFL